MYTITYSGISSLCETCFPLQKIKGIFVSVPTDIKMSQELSNIMKQSACSSWTQYGLQRFNHGLNSGNVQYSDQLHRIA